MNTTIIEVELVHVACPNCDVAYGISEHLNGQRRREGPSGTIWCPNGHQWHYRGKSHEQQLADAQKETRRMEAYANRESERASDNYEAMKSKERSLTATKGHITRLRNQIAAGTCPLCHEEVPGLKSHMAERHPEADGENVREGEQS